MSEMDTRGKSINAGKEALPALPFGPDELMASLQTQILMHKIGELTERHLSCFAQAARGYERSFAEYQREAEQYRAANGLKRMLNKEPVAPEAPKRSDFDYADIDDLRREAGGNVFTGLSSETQLLLAQMLRAGLIEEVHKTAFGDYGPYGERVAGYRITETGREVYCKARGIA